MCHRSATCVAWGARSAGSINRDASTIPAYHLNFRMRGHPPLHALRLAISQQVDNFVRLQVDENTAEALAAPPTPIVHSDDSHMAILRPRKQKQRPEHGSVCSAQPKLGTQTLPAFA